MTEVRSLRQKLLGLFSDTGFRGPVLSLMSGSGITLAAAYFAQPILTRIYGPEAFGVSDYFVGVMAILTPVASLRYEDAVMTPERDRDAGHVIWLSAILSMTTVVLLTLAIPFSNGIARAIGFPEFARWVPLIPLGLFFSRISRLSDLWLARNQRFRIISAGEVGNKLTMLGTRLGAGAFTSGAGGLIGGFVVGPVVSSVVYVRAMVKRGLTPPRPDLGGMRRVLSAYRRFPQFTLPSALLSAVVSRLPVLLLPLYFTIEIVGYYGRAFVVLAIPLSLLGNAIAQVFFVRAAQARSGGNLPELTAAVHGRLVLLGVYPTLVLIAAGPALFDFVLGDAWRTSGEFVRLIGMWLMLASVSAPLTRLFDVLERQRTELMTSVFTFILLTSTIVLAGRTGDIMLTLLLTGVAGSLSRVVQLSASLRVAGVRLGAALRPYIRYALYSIPGIVLTMSAEEYISDGAAFGAMVVGGLVYLGLAYRQERRSRISTGL